MKGIMKKPFKIIWVARANDGKDSLIGIADTYEAISKLGQKYHKKTKNTHYLRTYAEVQEGDILCERDHCYKSHFNFCPHCGNKLLYKDDPFIEGLLSQ